MYGGSYLDAVLEHEACVVLVFGDEQSLLKQQQVAVALRPVHAKRLLKTQTGNCLTYWMAF